MTDVDDTWQYLEPFNLDLCEIELLEIEQLDHLTVCKQSYISNIYLWTWFGIK